jgi:hypothetical protein
VTKFKSQLDAAKNTGPAVLFLLCRVGNDQSAARSLKELNTAAGVKDLIFYGEDPIDTKLESVGGDIDTYVGVVRILFLSDSMGYTYQDRSFPI